MLPRPSYLRFDPAHHINAGTLAWFAAPSAGSRAVDLLRPDATITMNSGISIANGVFGSTFRGDGGANSYIDLGSTNRFVANTTTPLTISWIESPETSPPAYAAVMTLTPGTGTSERFFVFRGNDTTIDLTHYGNLSCGLTGSAGVALKTCFLGPTQASGVGLYRVFVLAMPEGFYAGPTATKLHVDGVSYDGTAGGGFSSQTTPLNYFGWDGVDSKYFGRLDNLRIWNYVLSESDIDEICADPYLGARPNPRIFLFAATASSGTLKTANGLASASVKTFQGLARASVKTANGLTP